MALANAEQDEPIRTMFSPPWACIRGCGACCYLAPEERDLDCMTAEDRDLYISMAGKDGKLSFDHPEVQLNGMMWPLDTHTNEQSLQCRCAKP